MWGNKDNVPALTTIASDGDYFVKEAAKAALVSIMNSSEGRRGGKLTAAAPKATGKKSPAPKAPEEKPDDPNASEQKSMESSE